MSAATIFETSVIYAGSGQISSLAHHNRNVIVLFVFGERNDTAVNGSSVNKKGNNSFFHVVRVLDVDIIVGIAVVSVDIISAQSEGMQGLIRRPFQSGQMPRMYWEILTKVHAAVPVSQLFFASPCLGASAPATICA